MSRIDIADETILNLRNLTLTLTILTLTILNVKKP